MTDEKFTFISDVREKKRIARGNYNKRTHAGKGGAVKFPSDYLSQKELKAMNGEVKSYRLNDPMKWQEFKALPDDIKVVYIEGIRERFRVSDSRIFKMFGVSQATGQNCFSKLGLCLGRKHKFKNPDIDGWNAWTCTIHLGSTVEENKVESPDTASTLIPTASKAVPHHGSMAFDSNPYDALRSIEDAFKAMVLEGKVLLTVYWDILDGDSNG